MRHIVLIALVGGSAAFSAPPAPDTGTPQAMMAALYDNYRDHGLTDIWVSGKDFMYLAPDLAALETRLQKQYDNGQDDDPTGHDADDFCGCQDTDHPRWTTRVDNVVGDKAQATGIFQDGPTKVVSKLSLIRTPKGWRISDYTQSGPAGSYRHSLEAEAAKNTKVKPHTYS